MNKSRHEERMLNGAERDMIVAALRSIAQRPLFPMAECEKIANEEFDRQIKIIESATNDKALSETGRASIVSIADSAALTAQRIASRIRRLATVTSTGTEVPAQQPLDRDKVMEVINGRLADYEEIESRNDLTELGRHAKLAIQNLKRDIEYALTSTVRHDVEKNEDGAS